MLKPTYQESIPSELALPTSFWKSYYGDEMHWFVLLFTLSTASTSYTLNQADSQMLAMSLQKFYLWKENRSLSRFICSTKILKI